MNTQSSQNVPKKAPSVRPKSARQASKIDPIDFPANHAFLVYFNCDGNFSLVKPDHSSWPAHLRSSDKLSMHYTDVDFKSALKPGTTVKGKVITNGPANVIERVGDYMNLQINLGVQTEDMNLTMVFRKVYEEIEREKENELPAAKQNAKEFRKQAKPDEAIECNLESQRNQEDEIDFFDEASEMSNESDDRADEPVFPKDKKVGSEEKASYVTTAQLVNHF